jgi:hypothetical protein
MATGFILYRLKQGVNLDAYRKFSIEIDQPITRAQPGVERFEVIALTGSRNTPRPFDICEIVQAESWQRWREIGASEPMKPVQDGFKQLADETSLTVVWGERIDGPDR